MADSTQKQQTDEQGPKHVPTRFNMKHLRMLKYLPVGAIAHGIGYAATKMLLERSFPAGSGHKLHPLVREYGPLAASLAVQELGKSTHRQLRALMEQDDDARDDLP